MQINPEFTILSTRIQTITIFIFFAVLFSLYAVWREGRKDGFDQEKIFDNYLVTLLIALVFSRVAYAIEARFLFWPFIQHIYTFWSAGLNLQGFIVGFLVGTFGLSFIYKWSVYRILDIYSLALSLGVAVLTLGVFAISADIRFLVFCGVLLLFYGVFSVFRLKWLFSGAVFVIFLFLVVASGLLIDLSNGDDLLFNFVLVTISVVTLFLRLKKKMINKRTIPKDLLSRLKEALVKKYKGLATQKKLLDEEDPYLQPNRAEGNADDMDEAHLEDNQKNIIDAQKSIIREVSGSIKKALRRMQKGDYGVCEKCGSAIDSARLKAYPEASTCSDCARKQEMSS